MKMMKDDIKKVLLSEEELHTRVSELGAQLSRDYEGKNLLMVSVLKGSVVFMADLMRAISQPAEIDFMVVSSYGSGVKSLSLIHISPPPRFRAMRRWLPRWSTACCGWALR